MQNHPLSKEDVAVLLRISFAEPQEAAFNGLLNLFTLNSTEFESAFDEIVKANVVELFHAQLSDLKDFDKQSSAFHSSILEYENSLKEADKLTDLAKRLCKKLSLFYFYVENVRKMKIDHKKFALFWRKNLKSLDAELKEALLFILELGMQNRETHNTDTLALSRALKEVH